MNKRISVIVAGATIGMMSVTACTGGSASTNKGNMHTTFATGSSTSVPAAATQKAVTFAWQPNSVPNYIFPLDSATYYTVQNMEQFQKLMYRPLYMYGVNGQPVVQADDSLADAPVFDNARHTVTVKLKDRRWSDGSQVTAQDIIFWQHLVTAEKDQWGGYVTGLYPDNIKSVKADNPHQVTFTLDGDYNHTWFWYNELTYITPLPQAWDKTSDGGAPGSGGCTADVNKCKAVYKYLSGKARKLASYASDPLWQIVDGPWKLKAFDSSGNATFVPNTAYTGPHKPKIPEFKAVAFTSTDAEVNALRSGRSVDVGYVPAAQASVPLSGYQLVPWLWWGVDYLQPNYNNPKVGAILKQLYIRQALQHVVDQKSVIKGALDGYGSETTGPVPLNPSNPYASAYEKSDPYPFSVADSKKLLAGHGWSVKPNGRTTCTAPGSGPGQCGAGIKAGAVLELNLQYADYGTSYDQSMNSFRSNAAQAGITINVQKAPANTVIGNTVRCQPTDSTCSWQLSEYGGYALRPYPAPLGQELSSGNSDGSWNDPHGDSLIQGAVRGNSDDGLTQYQNYFAKQLPLIWQPLPVQQLSMINTKLQGVVPQNPMLTLTPENWYWSN
ncbi:ABC transporter substrate-binding protein [Flexivirga caeni]|uniref:ABC transporter substrate-binding protein n=1 Tax=Flexivirga caeni TaxID=2294115 RepID=A0A3M9M6W7_9MICO|nr:ABC transporter substrate-binding protein [Flexivirga caeni]RNI21319.1 ABC transporter substrate-binding protein [Flexivirga caeni]